MSWEKSLQLISERKVMPVPIQSDKETKPLLFVNDDLSLSRTNSPNQELAMYGPFLKDLWIEFRSQYFCEK